MTRVWILAVWVLVTACGGGDPTPTSGVATIGAAGGTLEARNASGGVLSLSIPAGALQKPTEIRIDPAADAQGVAARFQITPAGLGLQVPATLRFSAPRTLDARSVLQWRVAGESFAMPGVQRGTVVEAQTFTLGYVFSGALATSASTSGLRMARASRSPRALADTSSSAELVVASLDCDVELTRLGQQIDAALRLNDIDRAQALYGQAQAVLTSCQQRDTANLQSRACAAYQGASLLAQTIAADSYSAFAQVVTPLVATQANVLLTGAECNAPDLGTLLESTFGRFLDFLEADYAKPSFAADYDVAQSELRKLLGYQAACEQMGLQTACDRISDSLLPAVLDQLRAAAFRECSANDDPTVLSSMYAEDFTRRVIVPASGREQASAKTGRYFGFASYRYEDLESDLAHCRSTLTVRVFADAQGVPQELEPRRVTLQPGTSPGTYDTQADVTVGLDGGITIGGSVRALSCPDGSSSLDELVARINGKRVGSQPVAGKTFAIDTSPFPFIVTNLLTQAGLDATTTTSFTIDLFREGPACAGLFDAAFKLYSVRVGLERATLRVAATLPSIIAGATPVVVVVDSGPPGGPRQPAPGVAVAFTATCAAVAPASGTTDASGRTSAVVTPNPGCTAVSVRAVASGTIGGVAATAEQTVSAAVASPSSPLFSGTLTQVGSELVSNGDGESWNFTADVALALRSDGTVDSALSRASGTYRKEQRASGPVQTVTGDTVFCELIETIVGTFDRVSGGGGAITLSGTGTIAYSGTKRSGATCIDGSEPPKAKAISSNDPGSNIGAPTGFTYRELLGADGTLRALDFSFSSTTSGQPPGSPIIWTATLTTTGVLQRP